MQDIIIKNITIVNPAVCSEFVGDIFIRDGKFLAVGGNCPVLDSAIVIDGTSLFASPAFCDMHVHLREPGYEYKEDIVSGGQAAAAGGYSAVCCMPNTNPVCDNVNTLEYILERSKSSPVRIYPIAAITKGLEGRELCDLPLLKFKGAVGVSDDGFPTVDKTVLAEALSLAKKLSLPVICHSERIGAESYDGENEIEGIRADLDAAREADAPVHIAHVSTKAALDLIAEYKRAGVQVTCETAPHYISLTKDDVFTSSVAGNPNFKMNPPLRSHSDALALIEGIKTGLVSVIATDHAPHSADEKLDFESALNGITGLETAFAVSYTALVKPGHITLPELITLMSVNPRRIMNILGGAMTMNGPADMVIYSTHDEVTINRNTSKSKSRNTPFDGMTFWGKIICTIAGREIVYEMAEGDGIRKTGDFEKPS